MFQNTSYQPLYQQSNHIRKDVDHYDNKQDTQEHPNKIPNLYTAKQDDSDILKEFTVSKSDPKYQTLPYNTKFTVNLVPTRTNNRTNENNNNIEIKEAASSWAHANGNVQSHMTVHSAPLSVINKNIATPLNQNDLLNRKLQEQPKELQPTTAICPISNSSVSLDAKNVHQNSNKFNNNESSNYPTHPVNGASTNYQVSTD